MSMSQVILIGHLGADPELKYTKNGNPVVTLSVGVHENTKGKQADETSKKTFWHKCRRWGLKAEAHKTQLKKGDKVFIKGELTYDHWEDKNGKKHKDAVIEIDHLEKMYYENITIDLSS